MQTVGLSISQAFEAAGVLTVAGVTGARMPARKVRWFSAALRELAVIAALYGLWQLARQVSLTSDVQAAFARARWIEHVEAWLPLPSEAMVQHWFLGLRPLVEGANLYYASMHLTGLLLFLAWLFVRHRDQYRPVRQVMAWTTLGCLLIQLLPTAPPRYTAGIVDTAHLYHQSVYDNGLPFDHLSAMPSVHVAWAVLVGWYVWRISPSRWRFIGPLHAAVTIFVVVVTGNHWWLDGIVAVLVLVLAAWGVRGGQSAAHALRARVRPVVPTGEPAVTAA